MPLRITLTILLMLCAFCTATFEQLEADDNENIEWMRNQYIKNVSFSRFMHPCQNPYVHSCSTENILKKSTVEYLSSVRTHLKGILNSRPSEHEIASLSIEKEMYQKCLYLGKYENEEAKLETQLFVERTFNFTMNPEYAWQTVDQDSYDLGLGHTFFVVKTVNDPKDPNSTIISLQPPPFKHLRQLTTLIRNALGDVKTDFDKERNYIWRIYRHLAKKYGKPIDKFFYHWLEMYSSTLKASANSINQAVKMTIEEWQRDYDDQAVSRRNTQINWLNTFKDVFTKVHVKINPTDSILITNRHYFVWLADLLSQFPNEVIVSAMRAKFMTENLRYTDWEKAEALSNEKLKRSKFCFEDTKLYGLSYRFIHDLIKTESAHAPHHKTVENIIKHVADTIISEMNHSQKLLSSEKIYLESQVHRITSYIFNFKHYREHVSNYYEDYKVSSSYLISIINYRKQIEKSELNLITIKPEYPRRELIPFSVNDARNPHNRFMLYVYLNMKMHISNDVPKEILYGAYGSKIAGYLYSLLNENRFHDGVLEHTSTDWSAHPHYPEDTLKCLVAGKLKYYGYDLAVTALTELVGVKLAHKALLKDLEHSNNALYMKKRSQDEGYTVDKLYLIAYMKYHCDLEEKVFNTIVQNLPLFHNVHVCNTNLENEISECSLNPFEFQEKSIFSSKS